MLRTMLKGDLPHKVKELHDLYGPIVRTAPNELSFIDPQAWRDIHQRRDFMRPRQWRGKPPGLTADSFISADAPNHARLRRVFAPSFSDKAIKGYEPSMQNHIDVLCRKLHTMISSSGTKDGTVIEMIRWLNFCLFDITTDIGWGTTFALLETGSYHPWVAGVTSFKDLFVASLLDYYPPALSIATRLMPKSAMESIKMILSIARDNVRQRLQTMQTERADIFGNALGTKQTLDQAGVTEDEMVAVSINYTIAGTEPVTTVLAGAIGYLIRNPESLGALVNEVRTSFDQSRDITAMSTQSLPFLNAVLKETLRLCPPTPDGMRREIPADGGVIKIAGQILQPGTIVSVPPLASFTSETNYQYPLQFIPERWLDSPLRLGGRCARDFNDRKESFHPFSLGPRGCIGQNLGWMEMRIILSRLFFEFDLGESQQESLPDWQAQKIYWIWDKQPLHVVVSERKT